MVEEQEVVFHGKTLADPQDSLYTFNLISKHLNKVSKGSSLYTEIISRYSLQKTVRAQDYSFSGCMMHGDVMPVRFDPDKIWENIPHGDMDAIISISPDGNERLFNTIFQKDCQKPAESNYYEKNIATGSAKKKSNSRIPSLLKSWGKDYVGAIDYYDYNSAINTSFHGKTTILLNGYPYIQAKDISIVSQFYKQNAL